MPEKRTEDYCLEIGPMGPIGEHDSLILRVNRNCPWNRCLFCPVYKTKQFSKRNVEEIMEDIDAVSRIWGIIDSASWHLGLGGRVSAEVVRSVIEENASIYGGSSHHRNETQAKALQSLYNVANWIYCGTLRVFLQDADAMAMPPKRLSEILAYIKKSFPHVETISTYARSKTCSRRSSQEIESLRRSGLSWCYVGIESGCDEVLAFMNKGVSRDEHIDAGRKLKDAGVKVAAFVMPGLGGGDRERSRSHMEETISVLNHIRPAEVRVRSLAVQRRTPLFELVRQGTFRTPGEDQMVEELGMLIQGLDFDCTFETLQLTNLLFHVRGNLSQNRSAMLDRIGWYLSMPDLDKARYILDFYLSGGYLDCVQSCNLYDRELADTIETARQKIPSRSADALEYAGQAAFAIKSRVIP